MDSNFSRRRFLETSAVALGVSLLGCRSDETGVSSKAGAASATAQANPDGTFNLTGVAGVEKGKAMAFSFPDGQPGLFFVTQSGETGAVSAKCTHAGCTVEWQGEAKVPLRCPCHESLFSLEGKVISGPAKAPLSRFSVTTNGNEAILKSA